jgi:hypothetical protein
MKQTCPECRRAFRPAYDAQAVCGKCRDAYGRPDPAWDPTWAALARAQNFALVHLEETHGL